MVSNLFQWSWSRIRTMQHAVLKAQPRSPPYLPHLWFKPSPPLFTFYFSLVPRLRPLSWGMSTQKKKKSRFTVNPHLPRRLSLELYSFKEIYYMYILSMSAREFKTTCTCWRGVWLQLALLAEHEYRAVCLECILNQVLRPIYLFWGSPGITVIATFAEAYVYLCFTALAIHKKSLGLYIYQRQTSMATKNQLFPASAELPIISRKCLTTIIKLDLANRHHQHTYQPMYRFIRMWLVPEGRPGLMWSKHLAFSRVRYLI